MQNSMLYSIIIVFYFYNLVNDQHSKQLCLRDSEKGIGLRKCGFLDQ
jgi:hypothetical protein